MSRSGPTCLTCGILLPADSPSDLCPRCHGDVHVATADFTPRTAAWAERIRRAGVLLHTAGALQIACAVLTPAFLAMAEGVDVGEIPVRAMFAVQLLVALVLGPMIIWGGQAARLIQEPGRVRVAAWLAVLPVSPAVVVGLPAGLWMLYLMRQPEVLEEFLKSEKKVLAQQIYEEELVRRRPLSESPWYALGWIVGHAPWTRVFMLLSSLLAALFVLGSWRTVETVMNQERMQGMFRRSVDEAGSQFVHGNLVAFVGIVAALVVLYTFRRRSSPWRGYVVLHAGLIVLIAAIVFVAMPPVTPMGSVIHARYGAYWTLWLGVALTLLAIRDLRRSLRLAASRDPRPSVKD